MQYQDPNRPIFKEGPTDLPLHVSGAPMPSIYLVRPMELEDQQPDENGIRQWRWGWLACIHAARGKNSFSHFYGTIRDLGAFQREFLENPEEALARYFKWSGPDLEEIKSKSSGSVNKGTIEEDLFA